MSQHQIKKRCFGNGPGKELYAAYHDYEWGVPVYDDKRLFEMLVLEGAQAGLNWEIVLKKREGYRKIFYNFDPQLVANMSDNELDQAFLNSSIIRNRLKIISARQNAKVFLELQKEFKSFSQYAWSFVNDRPVINHWKTLEDIPCETKVSDSLSQDLKRRGMQFVGPKIIYAYMQAVGMVNDHLIGCNTRS